MIFYDYHGIVQSSGNIIVIAKMAPNIRNWLELQEESDTILGITELEKWKKYVKENENWI